MKIAEAYLEIGVDSSRMRSEMGAAQRSAYRGVADMGRSINQFRRIFLIGGYAWVLRFMGQEFIKFAKAAAEISPEVARSLEMATIQTNRFKDALIMAAAEGFQLNRFLDESASGMAGWQYAAEGLTYAASALARDLIVLGNISILGGQKGIETGAKELGKIQGWYERIMASQTMGRIMPGAAIGPTPQRFAGRGAAIAKGAQERLQVLDIETDYQRKAMYDAFIKRPPPLTYVPKAKMTTGGFPITSLPGAGAGGMSILLKESVSVQKQILHKKEGSYLD